MTQSFFICLSSANRLHLQKRSHCAIDTCTCVAEPIIISILHCYSSELLPQGFKPHIIRLSKDLVVASILIQFLFGSLLYTVVV